MAKDKVFTFGKLIELTAGEEKDIELFTVEPARTLIISKAIVAFPADQKFLLEIYVKHGMHQIIPTKGILAGDGHQYSVICDYEAPANSKIILHAKNKDTVNPQSCLVVVEGCFI